MKRASTAVAGGALSGAPLALLPTSPASRRSGRSSTQAPSADETAATAAEEEGAAEPARRRAARRHTHHQLRVDDDTDRPQVGSLNAPTKQAKKDALFETAKRLEELRTECRVDTEREEPQPTTSFIFANGEKFEIPVLTFIVEHRRPTRGGDSERRPSSQRYESECLLGPTATIASVGASSSDAAPGAAVAPAPSNTAGGRRGIGRWLPLSTRRRSAPLPHEGGPGSGADGSVPGPPPEAAGGRGGAFHRLKRLFFPFRSPPEHLAQAVAWEG